MIVSMSQTAPRKWLRLIVGAPPSPITRFLVKFAIPITSCGPTWPADTTRSQPSRSTSSTSIGIGSVNRPPESAEISVAADLSEPHQSLPPSMPEDPVERDPAAEQQLGLVRRHRRVRAQRGQNGDVAPGGGQVLVQESRDLSRPRVQPRVVGRDEQHPLRACGDDLGRRELVDDLPQLVDRDRLVGAAGTAERFRHAAAHAAGSEK